MASMVKDEPSGAIYILVHDLAEAKAVAPCYAAVMAMFSGSGKAKGVCMRGDLGMTCDLGTPLIYPG